MLSTLLEMLRSISWGDSLEFDYLSVGWGAVLLFLAPLLRTKTKLDFFILFAWTYGVLSLKFPWFASKYPVPVQVGIENSQNELLILLALFSILINHKVEKQKIAKYLNYLCRITIVLSVLTIPFKMRWVSGVVPNKSMNAILIAMLLPYSTSLRITALGVLVIVLSKSSCAYLALAVMALLILHEVFPSKRLVLCAVLLLGGLGVWLMPGALDGGTRFRAYRFFFSDFHVSDFLFGKGPSSFFSISAFRQAKEGFDMGNGFYLWMHSDFMQYVFEYGVLGLVPLWFVIVWVYERAAFRDILAISAFLSGGLFYYPAHFSIHLLVLFFVLKIVASK